MGLRPIMYNHCDGHFLVHLCLSTRRLKDSLDISSMPQQWRQREGAVRYNRNFKNLLGFLKENERQPALDYRGNKKAKMTMGLFQGRLENPDQLINCILWRKNLVLLNHGSAYGKRSSCWYCIIFPLRSAPKYYKRNLPTARSRYYMG